MYCLTSNFIHSAFSRLVTAHLEKAHLEKAGCRFLNRELWSRRAIVILALIMASASGRVALAYEVEAGSQNNQLYILLRNLDNSVSYDQLNVTFNAPDMLQSAAASILPINIAAGSSDIILVEFDIDAGAALNSSEELFISIDGEIDQRAQRLQIPLPLTIVDASPVAQGYLGSGLPVAGTGVDTDGDGVSDQNEQAFGSDPNNAASQAGEGEQTQIDSVTVPVAFGAVAALGFLLLAIMRRAVRHPAVGGHKSSRLSLWLLVVSFTSGMFYLWSGSLALYPQPAHATNPTRIQIVADVIEVAPAATELAITSSAASTSLGSNTASLSHDGNAGTRWESQHGVDPSWISYDLGDTYALTSVEVDWEAANAATYLIEGSTDNSNWISISAQSGGTFGDRSDQVSLAANYRYLRLYGQTRTSVYGYSIWETRIFGGVAQDTDGDGIDDRFDLCPATPAARSINELGCIFIDSDDDGIEDDTDLCPDTPVNSNVDSDGCVTNVVLLSATATASSTGPAGGASFAVDGNMQSRWESAHGIDPSWITLDLGASYLLDRIVIHWEAANAASYEVQGSVDNSSWTTLSSQTGGTFGNRTDEIVLTGNYRYVRVYGQTRTSDTMGQSYGYSIYEIELYGEPAADADGDGVPDSLDQCPDTSPGSMVDSNGCVIVDSDGDGVPDGSDLCPLTPPVSNVDATGCIIIIPVNEVTSINNRLAGASGSSQPGLTLYVFDNDLSSPGNSNCNDVCATTWPPLLVADGVASGVEDLSTIQRSDGSTQAAYNGRPLYFYAGDSASGDTNGEGLGGVWHTVAYQQLFAPLFDNTTPLEPVLQEDTGSALITRLADRARDRHARESQFQQYDHFLSFYWEHRTAQIEIIDTVGHGGNTITFNVITEWPLHPTQAELRFFHLQAAVYANNGVMSAVPALDDPPPSTQKHYTRSVNFNPLTGQPLQVGDRMEFELSQFLTGTPNGRDNYYGTAILYVVGQGVEPFEAENPSLVTGLANPSQNPYPMPAAGRLGGDTTLNYQYSDEPDNHFMQMPTNLSNINGQTFVLGRRVHHSDFGDGSHDEAAENSGLPELANTLGINYINRSCVSCHVRNGRALPPATGQLLDQYVVKVGNSAGDPDPQIGSVLQPRFTTGASEGEVSIASWTENNGLRAPVYSFTGNIPSNFSARIAPQLVGMGLLEAIEESDIIALADEADSNSDGISGRVSLVTDAVTNETRIGRFGWKASQPSVKQQVAAALNGDIGVMTSLMPDPDCGSLQTNCGASGAELSDERLQELTAYISLLGVSARRDLSDAEALQGESLFNAIGCNSCHVDTFQTSPYYPHAELRDQTIHPYTDLLLHDMGPGLASTLTEGSASGSEWRTAPLWNIGLTDGVSGGEAYLHDGRARTLHEAIMWHGGESQASQQTYDALSAQEKDALIAFLKSL